jgi:hypothetical protein
MYPGLSQCETLGPDSYLLSFPGSCPMLTKVSSELTTSTSQALASNRVNHVRSTASPTFGLSVCSHSEDARGAQRYSRELVLRPQHPLPQPHHQLRLCHPLFSQLSSRGQRIIAAQSSSFRWPPSLFSMRMGVGIWLVGDDV